MISSCDRRNDVHHRLFLGVGGSVQLRGFVRMMLRVQLMGVGKVSMMRDGFMIAVFVMRSGFMMVLRSMFVVFCGLLMVFVSGLMYHDRDHPLM
jgi:hypothetical protein